MLVTFLAITYYLYGKFELPSLFFYLAEKIGFEVFLPRGGSSSLEKILSMIRELTGNIWSIMYFADLFLYQFKIYNDGNGVPLA